MARPRSTELAALPPEEGEAGPSAPAASGVETTEARDDEARGSTLSAAGARLGTNLGGYTLETVLGVGGTACVYRGKKEDGTTAALKVLHAWLAADPRAKKRFLREATVASKVRHPAIVRMLGEGEDDDGTTYLVMELSEGETIESRRAAAGGRLETEEVIRLADDLLSVLAVAHAQGVVHRDIKPSNLLRSPSGELRVLDFGIARVTELSDTSSLVTRSGAVLGTVFFMPPEQALGVSDEIDARSDVWAVGATMFTLLTGQLVHRARTMNEALVVAATRSAPPIRSVEPSLSAPIAAVVDRALRFDRNKRYSDATAMREALLRAERGELDPGAPASSETLPETSTLPERDSLAGLRSRSRARPRRTAVFVAGAAALIAALSLGALAWKGSQSAPSSTASSKPFAEAPEQTGRQPSAATASSSSDTGSPLAGSPANTGALLPPPPPGGAPPGRISAPSSAAQRLSGAPRPTSLPTASARLGQAPSGTATPVGHPLSSAPPGNATNPVGPPLQTEFE